MFARQRENAQDSYLAQGQLVQLTDGGVSSSFTANFFGATGNDLVLQWANTRLLAWGDGTFGKLGNNSNFSPWVPAPVDSAGVLAGKTIISVGGGWGHSLALCSDGTLAAWGYNYFHELGSDSTIDSSLPVPVDRSGVLAGKTVIAIAVKRDQNLALCSDGTLVAWGSNLAGQLGNDSTVQSSGPVAVDQSGVLAGKKVIAISAGGIHNLALCADGTLASWGANDSGQLGNNSSTFSSVPVLVNTGALKPGERFAPRSQVAGDAHTLAVVVSPPPPAATTGAATGLSDTGATLNGSVNPSGTSTAVSFEYGLTTNYGATVAASPPAITGTEMAAVGATLTDLRSGTTYHYRLVADGPGGVVKGADLTFTTSAFARLSSLALSDGTLDPGFAPVLTRYAATVPSSVDHLTITLATETPGASVTVNGAVVVAGTAGPIQVTEGPNPIAIIVTSADGLVAETYMVLVTRLPQTFRFQAAGQVGATVTNLVATGSTANFELNFAPPTGTNLTVINNTGIRPIAGTFSDLAQGQAVTLSHGGISYSFVANYFGGNGNDLVLLWANTRVLSWGGDSAGESLIPMPVDGTGILSNKSVIALAAGQFFSVAVCSDGTVAAWGYNSSGRLGNNSTTDSKVPVAVVRSGVLANKVVVDVAAGGDHVVALCSDGTLAAWGSNDSGKLGNNGNPLYPSKVPVAVNTAGMLVGKAVVAIAAGFGHSLALCSDGVLVAWGSNSYGQLGNAATTNSSVPVAVDQTGVLANKTVIAIAAGGYHSLALCADGTLAAWGRNDSGELGTNTTIRSSVPVTVTRNGVLSGKTIAAVAAGAYHNLVLCTDGTVAAWGSNGFGQLGNNTAQPSMVPVAIDRSGGVGRQDGHRSGRREFPLARPGFGWNPDKLGR